MTRVAPLTLALAVAASPGALVAQEAERPPSPVVQTDTLFPQPPLSPWGAFFRSLVLPGWAQAELGFETRGAFYFFVEATSLFFIFKTQERLDHAERNLPPDAALIERRKQQREDWIALAVFTAFFSAADGWVSVQLWGFDERTGMGPDAAAFSVGWQIPLGP